VDAGQDSHGHGDTDSRHYRYGWHDGRLACDCGIANRCQGTKENSRHSPERGQQQRLDEELCPDMLPGCP
jgi:hypothetical protein